jgi:hypothetical protein
VGEDARRGESGGADDVDHLPEVAELPLKVLDVLLEAGPLALRELEAEVKQCCGGLAERQSLAVRVGGHALLQAVVEPDADLFLLRFHSLLPSLSLPQSETAQAAHRPERLADGRRGEGRGQAERHPARRPLRIPGHNGQAAARTE